MNLAKLFQTQKVLRDRIGYEGPDRFEKLILALLVEIGECANEWRGFKFWSKDQKPRTFGVKGVGHGIGTYNPLLKKYVDGLHFVLEIGLEKFEGQNFINNLNYVTAPLKKENIITQFNFIFDIIGDFTAIPTNVNYLSVIESYISLGEMLGFTWEEIESAYYAKNQINHERQDTGY